jgi:hypothetical protein
MPATEDVSAYDIARQNDDAPKFEDAFYSALDTYSELMRCRAALLSYVHDSDEAVAAVEAELLTVCILMRDALCQKFGRPPLAVSP